MSVLFADNMDGFRMLEGYKWVLVIQNASVCERKHLKKDLEYINLVSLILEKGFDFLKLDMDVVAMDTLSPVKRGLFNNQTRILKAYGYESGYKYTEVQSQQTEQVYSGDANLRKGDKVYEDANEDAYSVDSIDSESNERIMHSTVRMIRKILQRLGSGGSMHLFWWIKYQLRLQLLKGGDHKYKPVFKNPEVTSNWVSQKVYSSIINNLRIGSGAKSEELRKRFNTSTTKKRLCRAEKQVLQITDSDLAKHKQDYMIIAILSLQKITMQQRRFNKNYKVHKHF
ncbi:hypothetical protein WN943_025631 [Citrus x changshan-huyou]